MNGIHDIGGMHGLGPIVREDNEPVFHEPWEARVFSMFAAAASVAEFPVDEFRHGIERMDPAAYLQTSYYDHWLHTFETVLIERGFITREEYDARIAQLAKEQK